ncbi:MAG: O-antigen ligase family protein [Candidatus Omnitrophica bacterium]|nr:O-antigen ligase family protein [Candidatus Omnitrophota bacterium]
MGILLDYIEKLRFLTIAAVLLLTPVLVDLQIGVGAGPETKFRFLQYGVLLAVLFTLPLWCARRTHSRFNTIAAVIAAWILYILARAAVDDHREFAMDAAFQPISWLLLILLIADACAGRKEFFQLLWIAAIGQLGPVILAVGNIFGEFIFLTWIKKLPWVWQSSFIGADRAVIWSSLGNPNYYASYGGILLIWLITLAAASRDWRARLLWIAYSVIVLITLAYTFTRGIWISLIPTLLLTILFLAYRKDASHSSILQTIQRRWKQACFAACALILLITAFFALESNNGPLHNTARRFHHGLQLRDASLRARPLMWYAALRMWRENPLWGQGLGRYAPRFLDAIYTSALETDPQRIQHVTREMNTIRTDQAHNDYLQTLAETGLIGYSLLILFLISLLTFAVCGLLRSHRAQEKTALLAGCTAVLVMIIIQCLYDFPLLLPASAVLFALAAGGVILLTRKEKGTLSNRPAYFRWIISLAAIPLLAAAAGLILSHLASSHNLNKAFVNWQNGMRSIQQSDPAGAFTHFHLAETRLNQANRLFPRRGAVLFDLGRLYASQFRIQRDPRLRMRAIDHLERSRETWCVPETYQLLCNLYLEESRFAQAQKMSDILLIIDPNREDANFLAAQIDEKARKYQEAARHLRKEIQLHPYNTNAIALLGRIEQEQFNNLDEAAALYQKVLDLEPGSVDIHFRLALIQVQLNELSEARQHFDKALEGARALSMRDLEKQIIMEQNKLERDISQQEGRSNESGSQ